MNDMLEINMEFRKGILFVRLIGELTKNTVDIARREVGDTLKEYGIANVVFNISELETIDDVGIDVMKENSKLAKAYHGRTLLCGLHDLQMKKQLKQKQIFRYMDETSDELTALSIIHV